MTKRLSIALAVVALAAGAAGSIHGSHHHVSSPDPTAVAVVNG
jgi:hypothetical protein